MKKKVHITLFAGLLFFSSFIFSQESEGIKTIKIKKEKLFVKAAFDDTEFKVIAFDRYGNPHEQAIKSFCILYQDGKTMYQKLHKKNDLFLYDHKNKSKVLRRVTFTPMGMLILNLKLEISFFDLVETAF